MTRERIAEGLQIVALGLANATVDVVPKGWRDAEWAYVKGIAAGTILRMRDALVAPGTGIVDAPEESA